MSTAAPGWPTASSRSSHASLTTHAIWLMVAKTVGFAIAIALPLILVRRLSQEDLGIYKQVFFVVLSATNILPLGFGLSAYYFLPREPRRQGSVVANIVAFHAAGGLLIALTLLVWPESLALLFNSPKLAAMARLVGLVVLLWAVGSFLETVTVAVQDVVASTAVIIFNQFSKTTLLIVAALAAGTVESLVVAALIQGLLQVGLMLIYLHRRFPGFWRALHLPLLRTQAAYAVPLGLSALVLQLQDSLHHLFVSHAFGAAGYAIYSVGVFKFPLIGIMRESAGAVMLPRINQLESENNTRQILHMVAGAARKLALVYFPVCAFLLVAGRDVVVLLFTEQYAASWPVFAVSLVALPLTVLVLDPITRAHSERFFFMRMRLAVLAVVTVVLWLAARRLGLVGIISVVTAASLFTWSVAAIRMSRQLAMRWQDVALFSPVGRIALAASGATIACFLLRLALSGLKPLATVAVAGIVFAVVYAAAIWLLRVVPTEEVAAMWRDLRRRGRVTGASGPRLPPFGAQEIAGPVSPPASSS